MSGVRWPVPALAGSARGGVVWVHVVEEWFAPQQKETSFFPWRHGLTAQDLAPPWSPEATLCLRNGARASLGDQVDEGDHLTFVQVPGGPLPVWAVNLIVTFIVTSVAAYISYRLTTPPEEAREPERNASPTYNWSGIRTNYQPAGMPYPMVLGAHWTGGAVIQEFVEAVQGPQPTSYLYLLIALSTGPVQSIAGITDDSDNLTAADLGRSVLVNGNAALTFAGVQAWIRMGSLNQEAIAVFNQIRSTKDIDLLLDQVAEGEGSPLTNWENAVEFDFDGDADRCRLGFSFPRGLYQTDGGGSLISELVEIQARYRPVSGGDWQIVYFGSDDILQVQAAQQGAFEYDAAFDFFDPVTINPPAPSNAYELNRIVDLHRAESGPLVNVPGTPFLSDTLLLEISFEFRMTTQVAGSGTDERFFSWGDWDQDVVDPDLEGFLVRMVQHPTNPSRAAVEVTWGNGAGGGFGTAWQRMTCTRELAAGLYFQVNVTYYTETGFDPRVRLYIDGVLEAQEIDSVNVKIPTDGLAVGCWNGEESAGNYAKVKLDELTIWGRELSPEEVVARHASGDWTEMIRPDLDPYVLCVYRFDTPPTFGTTFDWSSYGIDLGWLNGINFPEIVAGQTSTPVSGDIVRETYRVQVQRIDLVRGEALGVADDVRLLRATAIVDDELGYPGLALLGLRIQASDQLSSNRPNVLTKVSGRRDAPVWDGNDPDNPSFTRGFSRSPADHLALIVTSVEDGGGAYFGPREVDWEAFKSWRSFCGRAVYDLSGKYSATELEAVNPTLWGFGTADFNPPVLYQVTMPSPTPAGFSAGSEIKIVDVTDGPSGQWPEGVFEIVALVDDGTECRFVAAWPAGYSTPSPNPYVASPAATVFRAKAQLNSDLVLADRGVRFWGAVQMLCSLGRAAPVMIGDKLSVVYQDARAPVALFNIDNIVAGSLKVFAARKEDQINSAAAEIQDEALRNERTVIERRHSSLKDSSSTAAVRHKTFDMRGRTRAFQAARELDYQLNLSQGSNLRCEFDTFLEAAFVQVGDVAVIQYPLPTWSYGGKCPVFGDNPDELPIDIEVVLAAATTYYVAVRYSGTDEIAFQQVTSVAGTYPAGSVLQLAGNLAGGRVSGAPNPDLWVLGTSAFASKLFQLVDRRLTQSLSVRTVWAEYDESAFPADDEGETLESLMGHGEGGDANADQYAALLPSGVTGSAGYLATAAEIVRAAEWAYRDLKTGALVHSVRVSWRPDAATEHRIARTRVWVEHPNGKRELAAEVAPGTREALLSGIQFERNAVYRITVQHQAQDGTRRDYSLCPSARLEVYGLFSPPVSMDDGAGSISGFATGDTATYEVVLPDGFEGASVQLYRGDTFVGEELGSLPAGATQLVGTPDWYGGTLAAPILARLRNANGTRGAFLSGSPTFAPPGYTLLDETDYADGPWDTKPGGASIDPVLTDLEIESPYGHLRWPTANMSLSASYETWEVDLTTAARRHVSCCLFGVQQFGVSAENTVLGNLPLSDPRMASWTPQGPLDLNAPDYDALGVVIEWQRSTSSGDPSGEAWEPFRSGPAYFRAARWRVSLTRPTTAWNIDLTRFSTAIRTIP